MKKYTPIIVLLGVTAMTLLSCSKKNKIYASAAAPQCLQAKIAAFSKSTGSCPTGASLKEYTFQHKTVYVFDPGHCGADMISPVLDADCKDIGGLGGFAGNMKINGEDFSNAAYVKTVWSN